MEEPLGIKEEVFGCRSVRVFWSGFSPSSLLYPSDSLVVQLVKNLPAMRETWVRSLGSRTVKTVGQSQEEGYQPCFLPPPQRRQRSMM